MAYTIFYKDGSLVRQVSAGWYRSGTDLLPLLTSQSELPVPPGEPTGALWFTMPARTSSNPVVFAHFFPPYPPRIDNVTPSEDYYARNFLTITGESGAHQAYGGMLRDRPYPLAVSGAGWDINDMSDWIRDAKAAGIDGFYVNLFGPYSASNWNWTWALRLRDAAIRDHPAFPIIPMIDTSTAVAYYTATATQVADDINRFAATQYALPGDGRMLVGTFNFEKRTVSFWDSVATATVTNHSIDIAYVGVVNNSGDIAGHSAVTAVC